MPFAGVRAQQGFLSLEELVVEAVASGFRQFGIQQLGAQLLHPGLSGFIPFRSLPDLGTLEPCLPLVRAEAHSKVVKMGGQDQHRDLGGSQALPPLRRQNLPHEVRDFQAVGPVMQREGLHLA
ncbi:MAG: hypothetical protein ABSE56_07630 [Bryobacteraceae bacterium]